MLVYTICKGVQVWSRHLDKVHEITQMVTVDVQPCVLVTEL